MPRSPSNRIQVDLKLLQDKNVEKLTEFGKQFDKSIDSLKVALGDYASQFAGAQGMQQPGATSAHASKASNVRIDSPEAREGGSIPPFANAPTGGRPPGPPGTPSIAPSPGGGPPLGVGGEGYFEQQYVRAQKRIGEIPVGARQFLGYIAESGERDLNPKSPTYGKPLNKYARWAGTVNTGLFYKEAITANLGLGFGHMQGMFASIAGPTLAGQELGRSRHGLFGTGLLSSAFKTGVVENLKSLVASDFGFNPNYSTEQARHARDVLHQFGYSGDRGDMLADRLKGLQVHQMLTPEQAMRLFDPVMRFGGNELSQLEGVLSALPDAARAARMNLAQFNEELTSTAQEVAASGNMTVTGAAAGLAAFSATTGLAPQKAANLLNDSQSMYMSMAMTGKSANQVTYGRNAMAYRMKFPLHVAESIIGMSMKQLAALKTTNYAAFDQKMSMLIMAQQANPQLFGGFNVKELVNMAARGNVVNRTMAEERLNTAIGSGIEPDFQKIIRMYGGGPQMIQAWQQARQKFLDQHGAPHTQAEQQAFRQAQVDAIRHRMQQVDRARGDQAAKTMTFVLSPEARQLLRFMQKDTPYANNQKGGGKGFASKAMGAGDWIAKEVLTSGVPGIPGTGVIKGISGLF